jgi:hypothetical protein
MIHLGCAARASSIVKNKGTVRQNLVSGDELKIDRFTAEQRVWMAHRSILFARGIDPASWAERQAQLLAWPEARACFAELSKKKCTPEVLAAILAIYRHSALLERIWTFLAGNPRKRQKVSNTLEKAALMIEDVFHDVMAAEDDNARAQYADMGRIPLSQLTSELRFYCGFLGMTESISSESETHTFREFLRYLLVGYIKRATDRFHDREVSALLAELDDAQNYNERAQSMWRSRNYKRLDAHHSKLADFVATMGIVIARRT